MVAGVLADILRDVAVNHPLRNQGEPSFLKRVRGADEIENVGMRQVFPRGYLFAKVLHGVSASLDEELWLGF